MVERPPPLPLLLGHPGAQVSWPAHGPAPRYQERPRQYSADVQTTSFTPSLRSAQRTRMQRRQEQAAVRVVENQNRHALPAARRTAAQAARPCRFYSAVAPAAAH